MTHFSEQFQQDLHSKLTEKLEKVSPAFENGFRETCALLAQNQLTTETATNLMHAAARAKDFKLVQFLVDGGVEISACDKEGSSVIHVVAEYLGANIDGFQAVLQMGADINQKNASNETPLQITMRESIAQPARNKRIQFLLENGADPNVRTEYGETPLEWAIDRASYRMADCLIEHHAKIDEKNSAGDAPLLYVAKRLQNNNIAEHEKPFLVRIYDRLVSVCDINTTDSQGNNLLLLHCKSFDDSYGLFITTFIGRKGDIHKKCSVGLSALWWAVYLEKTKSVEILLSAGAVVTKEVLNATQNVDIKLLLASPQNKFGF